MTSPIRATLYAATLLFAQTAGAQFRHTAYAVAEFEKQTGLSIAKPDENFVLCRGVAQKNDNECKPRANGPWLKSITLPTLVLNIPTSLVGIDTVIRNQVSDRYLAVAYVPDFLSPDCKSSLDSSRRDIYSLRQIEPIRSTTIAQLVQEEIIQDASARFDVLAAKSGAANKASLTSTFTTQLRRAIRDTTKNTATTKWVTVSLSTNLGALNRKSSVKGCLDAANAPDIVGQTSLVKGIAGFVVMSSRGSSDYVSDAAFTMAAHIALAGSLQSPLPATTPDSAVATIAASWSSTTNRKISQQIETVSPEATFYPLWVSFVRVK
jgi:hypothetical protein